ncbi:ATP-binding protein [Pseudothauera rhizosphaerae]|uniref:histidine kinase n=1 Tax=Pseudothauera rhizosphaerae TaxID=2565932 RepID=A0A4S4AYI6_9RHOO|nr:ATP-binding protein [Pseudothauera rhizosphaerae]THF65198.1 HAMP domain-containing protein [Pseudothauera rhizosphaerae]
MKRPGLTTRIFLAVFATAIVLVAAAGEAARWSFSQGFLGYLNDLALARMEAVVARTASAYAAHGDWDFIRGERMRWMEILRPVPGLDVPAASGPPSGPPSPPVSDLTGVVMRMALLDADRKLLAGFVIADARTEERPVIVEGRTVGWVSLAQFESVAAAGASRFEIAQKHALAAIGLAAAALAAAIAWWLARTLLRPVREVAGATHRLAGGDYALRVPVGSRDEVGRLAEDFNHLAETLQRNERMRRDFMADLSHELRTPLGVLHGELEAIEDGLRPFDAHALASLQGEVAMLSKLVSDLYDLSLADVGALAYRKQDVDLRDVLSATAEQYRERLADAGIALEMALPAAPVTLFADAVRLRQLFGNLFENSCRYTDRGGVLRIAVEDGGEPLRVVLDDTAPAVPPERLPHLFERFYRVDSSRNRASGGAGLGLAICRNIVEAHGGAIDAAPSPLGGLRLTIHLPRARP